MRDYLYSAVAGLALAGVVIMLQPSQGTATQPVGEAWQVDLLAKIGNTSPTQDTILFLSAWHRAEGGTATYNWLNTTQPAAGDSLYNSVGVRNYPDYATGIEATARTLQNGFYPRTLYGLQTNAPVVDDAEMGTWGTGGEAVRRQLEETQALSSVSLPTGSKAFVTPTMEIGAHFDTTDCGSWGFQVGCMHWGTDYLAPEGTPVTTPFDLTIISLGEYGPGPTMGQFVQGAFPDGYVFYAGHLEGRAPLSVGQTLPAGSLLGYTNSYAHTHVQLAPPGNTGPCAQDGTCVSFELYYQEH